MQKNKIWVFVTWYILSPLIFLYISFGGYCHVFMCRETLTLIHELQNPLIPQQRRIIRDGSKIVSSGSDYPLFVIWALQEIPDESCVLNIQSGISPIEHSGDLMERYIPAQNQAPLRIGSVPSILWNRCLVRLLKELKQNRKSEKGLIMTKQMFINSIF